MLQASFWRITLGLTEGPHTIPAEAKVVGGITLGLVPLKIGSANPRGVGGRDRLRGSLVYHVCPETSNSRSLGTRGHFGKQPAFFGQRAGTSIFSCAQWVIAGLLHPGRVTVSRV